MMLALNLKDTENDIVYVNPNHVSFVTRAAGSGSIISTIGGGRVYVTEKPAYVVTLINTEGKSVTD